MFFGSIGADTGAVTPFLYAFRDRERIESVFEAVSGARMMHNFIRVGGIKADLPDDFKQRIAREYDAFVPESEEDFEKFLRAA